MEFSTDVQTLLTFIRNDRDIQRQRGEPIRKNLRRKIAEGTFRKDLSVKAFRQMTDAATKAFQIEHRLPRAGFHFSIAVRNEAAKKLANNFAVEEGLR